MERQQDPYKIVVLGEGESRVRVGHVLASHVIVGHKHGGDCDLLTFVFANSESRQVVFDTALLQGAVR